MLQSLASAKQVGEIHALWRRFYASTWTEPKAVGKVLGKEPRRETSLKAAALPLDCGGLLL